MAIDLIKKAAARTIAALSPILVNHLLWFPYFFTRIKLNKKINR